MRLDLDEKQIIELEDFMSTYVSAKNAADGSAIDANANVTTKNIATMEYEMFKCYTAQLNKHILKTKINELFGGGLGEEFIRQINDHEIYLHDASSIKNYCASITMYPFLLHGMTHLGGDSEAPKHLSSFAGSFINLLGAVSAHLCGAVGTVEFLMYFDYFAKKDYGDNYLETNKNDINQYLQQVIYSLNQPTAARGYQSPFWNISLFDREYFNAVFGEFVFPDDEFTQPNYDSLAKLQKYFMDWFNEERKRKLLTFPVVTASALTENGKVKDRQFAEFMADQQVKGNSFFVYLSDNADSLSSCCFAGSQKILVRGSNKTQLVTFKEFDEMNYTDNKRNFTVFHNGSWVKGKLVKLPSRQMYKVITSNGKEIIVSDNHKNPTLRGDVSTTDLTTDDYLLFSTNPLDAVNEKDEHLTYEQGYAVGAFLGDGCFGSNRELASGESKIYETTYSLNKTKLDRSIGNLNKAIKDCGGVTECTYKLSELELVSVRISSHKLTDFIRRWTNWYRGTYSYNKTMNLEVLTQSREFREGIVAGLYDTDGGNSNRYYSTSKDLIESIEVLLTSLGLNSVIDVSDRTGEETGLDGTLHQYPLYCIRWYTPKNKRSMGDVYKVINNSMYFKIKSIERVDYDDEHIYCFEMENSAEPYFTLPNGIITHNCRLRNELTENLFSNSFGCGGVATGSLNVITLNFNRMVQKGADLKEQMDKLHKYQYAYRKIAEERIAQHLYPIYDEGFINIDKQFLTIGINGMVEAAEYLDYDISYNPKYVGWLASQLKIIFESNKEARKTYGCMFNTEFVPAENLGVKNAKWDREDGLMVNRDCYNSYFYRVEDPDVDPVDKIRLHGREVVQYLDGGSALHLNLEEYLTKDGFIKLYDACAKAGCNYFTTNVKVTICNKCGYINKNTMDHCTACGSTDVDYGTRIIGYLKRITAFSSPRQREESRRVYHKQLGTGKPIFGE